MCYSQLSGKQICILYKFCSLNTFLLICYLLCYSPIKYLTMPDLPHRFNLCFYTMVRELLMKTSLLPNSSFLFFSSNHV